MLESVYTAILIFTVLHGWLQLLKLAASKQEEMTNRKSKREKWGSRVLWSMSASLSVLSLAKYNTHKSCNWYMHLKYWQILHHPQKVSAKFICSRKEMIWDYRSFLGSGVCLHVLCILWKHSIFICSICLQTATCPRQAVLSPGFCSVPSALWPVCSYHSVLFLNPIRTSF